MRAQAILSQVSPAAINSAVRSNLLPVMREGTPVTVSTVAGTFTVVHDLGVTPETFRYERWGNVDVWATEADRRNWDDKSVTLTGNRAGFVTLWFGTSDRFPALQNQSADGTAPPSDEEIAQDAVGSILTDTATIDFTYNDSTPSITADVINDSITDAKLRDSVALSVIGRSANSTGNPADIAAANDGEVLRRSGTTLGFGTVATAGIANDAVTYAKIQNVSATDMLLGRSSAGAGDVEEIACTAAGRALIDDSTAAAQRATLNISGVDNAFTVLQTLYAMYAVGSNIATNGTALVFADSTIGPYVVGHTDASNNSTQNVGAIRIHLGGAGLIIQTSPATTVGAARTWTTRATITTGGLSVVNNLTAASAAIAGALTGATLAIGSGAVITKHLSDTASLDYAQAAANGTETLTITVTGAADGDTVAVGIPNALATHNTTSNFFCWATANTVNVRRTVITADGTNPAAATVRADVWKH